MAATMPAPCASQSQRGVTFLSVDPRIAQITAQATKLPMLTVTHWCYLLALALEGSSGRSSPSVPKC